jgi:enamine deaminase RidA (YjgF/YER057c/UK114 family)
MPNIAQRIAELGLTLPPVSPPAANYIGASRIGNILFVSGHGPDLGDGTYIRGKVGRDLTVAEGIAAARATALCILATMDATVGLDHVTRIVKVFGMVNTGPGFNNTPAIINGASDLFVEIWGEAAGKHARSAVGLAELPFDIAVEIELVAEVD